MGRKKNVSYIATTMMTIKVLATNHTYACDMREWCEGFGSEIDISNPSTSDKYKIMTNVQK